MEKDSTTSITRCYCPNCEEEFFKAYKAENGANVIVCISCNETVMCFYDIGGANDT